MNDPVLKIIKIRKSYDSLTALDNVSFNINAGETFGLLGPNGAGKSTLINILSGIVPWDSGEIEFFGKPFRSPTIELKRKLGVIPQEISLYEDLTGLENLELVGRLYGLSPQDLTNRISETLDVVGLSDRRKDRVKTYSGGMKRRLNIAAGLLHAPVFILMDEPTVGIDPQSRNLIFDVIEGLQKQNVTIIYTSHYMEEVERLCRRIAIIDHGKLIALGTKDELVAKIGDRDTVEVEVAEFKPDVRDVLAKNLVSMKPMITENKIVISLENSGGALAEIVKIVSSAGVEIRNVAIREPNLESVFLHLTGKELRD
jgi:ABC-2 type transport system ATP-binding protein